MSIDKFNFRLIKVNKFLQRFDLNIFYKSGKFYFIPNTLSRFIIFNNESRISDKFKKELNVLYIYIYASIFIEIDEKFRKKIITKYINDLI